MIKVVLVVVISTTEAVELLLTVQIGAADHVMPKLTVTEVCAAPVVTAIFCGLPATDEHPEPQVKVGVLLGTIKLAKVALPFKNEAGVIVTALALALL